MKYLYFDMYKKAIAADKIYKIVLGGDGRINFYYEDEVTIVNHILPDPEEFFLEGEEVDEDIIDDWFRIFCEEVAKYTEDKGQMCDSIHDIVEGASQSIARLMDGWRKDNPDLYKKKELLL